MSEFPLNETLVITSQIVSGNEHHCFEVGTLVTATHYLLATGSFRCVALDGKHKGYTQAVPPSCLAKPNYPNGITSRLKAADKKERTETI